jgi:ribosome-interacting GTPase 1
VDAVPVALPVGATVADAAATVHRGLASTVAGGRVWGASARFDGQRVGRAHMLMDGDVVELVR